MSDGVELTVVGRPTFAEEVAVEGQHGEWVAVEGGRPEVEVDQGRDDGQDQNLEGWLYSVRPRHC